MSLLLINFAESAASLPGLNQSLYRRKKLENFLKFLFRLFRYPNMEIDMEATKLKVLKHSLKKLYLPLHISATSLCAEKT